MNIDTGACQSIAVSLSGWQKSFYFYTYTLNQRHAMILQKMAHLQSFFSGLSSEAEQLESTLFQKASMHPGVLEMKADHDYNPKKNVVYVTADLHYDAASGKNVSYTPYSQSSFETGMGQAGMAVSCIVGLKNKKKRQNPHLAVEAKAEASLLSARADTAIGKTPLSLSASATGKVGTAEAKAKAVLSYTERDVEFHVGAAALEGEAECSFQIFHAHITLTGSGSLGCAQLGASYSHKNKEWEIGSKLGFIAGAGFKVKIKLDE